MTLVQIRVLLTVVETGSFSKSGELLGMSQPAISHAISGLEAELGVTLVNRGRSGITLTEIGEQVLVSMQKMLELEEHVYQTIDELKGLKKGNVKVGSFPSISASWLPGIITSFQQIYPQIDVIVIEGTYEEIENWLITGTIHTGFITLPCAQLDAVPLLCDEMAVVLSPNHPLQDESVIHLEQLAPFPFIMPNAGCQSLIQQAFANASISPQVRFELRETNTILNMVKAGAGVSILPKLALHSQQSEVLVKPLAPDLSREIGIAVRSQKTASPAVRAFTQHVQQWIKESQTTSLHGTTT